MTYTYKQRAEMAILANEQGKQLVAENGKLIIKKFEKSLEQTKEEKIEEINRARETAKQTDGAVYNNDTFDIDDTSQGNILSQVVLAQLNPNESFVYRSKTNRNHNLNASQIIALGTAIASKVQEIYQKSWTLKEKIKTAPTIEAIETINWKTP